MQDEIAKAIAERLRVTLAGGKDDRLVEQGTTNIEAYQLYLTGTRCSIGGARASRRRSTCSGRRSRSIPVIRWPGPASPTRSPVLAISGAARAPSRSHRRWRPRRDRSSSIRHPQRATPRWHVRRCCTRTTARWRSRSSSARWSSIRTTRRAAVGTRCSICSGPAASSSRASPKPGGRSTAIRCPRTSR